MHVSEVQCAKASRTGSGLRTRRRWAAGKLATGLAWPPLEGKTYRFGWGTSSVKTSRPALSPAQVGAVDAVLLSHDQHADNFDTAGRAVALEAPIILTTQAGATLYLETPIVIPPQIEFYATVRLGVPTALATTDRIVFSMFGTGTLLNTKESF